MRQRELKWVIGLISTALLAWLGLPGADAPRGADTLVGRVTSVADGDTLTLLVGLQDHRIRLGGIDAPESDQAHGWQARAALALMCLGRQAQVSVTDKDRYGRDVGQVRCSDTAVNAELVKQGHAWVYRAYNHDPTLEPLERQARSARLGLWSQARPTPPWEWRKQHRR
jgi:endonuclease YncB( thermonuclease family)